MEKLDKVIRALECCRINEDDPCEGNCPYCGSPDCVGELMVAALECLKEQNRLIEELSDHIPCCDNCEGKTTLGERTDKCVYEIEGFDSVLYCAKRGIENCFGYRKKIAELEAKLKESEPVVHAHWVYDPNGCDWGIGAYRCSHCDCKNGALPCNEDAHVYGYACAKRCPHCGAHMDEEVADGLYCSE